MKNLGFIFIFIVFIFSCSKNIEINHNKLVERKGLVYEVNSQKPFTGISIENYLSVNQNDNELQPFKRITYKDGYIINKIIFHSNGQISELGKYKDGLLDGPQESYFINGQLKYTSNYTSGKLDGVYESFFDNGNRGAIKNFKFGKLDGKLEEYYENGQIKLKSFYINGIIDGEYTEYYSNGQLKLKHFKTNGQSIGDQTGYYSNGDLKYLKSYNEDHLITYSKKQNIFNKTEEELNFIDGKKNGIINKFYDTGKIQKEELYKNNNLHGAIKHYYRNGKIDSIENYINGKKEGYQEFFFENGNRESKSFYKNNVITSIDEWDENGNKKYESRYKSGIKESKRFNNDRYLDQVETIFYKDDNKFKHTVISNSSGIKEICYFDNSLKQYCKYTSKFFEFNYSISYKEGEQQKKTIFLNDEFISEIDLTSVVPKGLDIKFNNIKANNPAAIGSWLSKEENVAYGIIYDNRGDSCSVYFDKFGKRLKDYDLGGCEEAKVLFSDFFIDWWVIHAKKP